MALLISLKKYRSMLKLSINAKITESRVQVTT